MPERAPDDPYSSFLADVEETIELLQQPSASGRQPRYTSDADEEKLAELYAQPPLTDLARELAALGVALRLAPASAAPAACERTGPSLWLDEDDGSLTLGVTAQTGLGDLLALGAQALLRLSDFPQPELDDRLGAIAEEAARDAFAFAYAARSDATPALRAVAKLGRRVVAGRLSAELQRSGEGIGERPFSRFQIAEYGSELWACTSSLEEGTWPREHFRHCCPQALALAEACRRALGGAPQTTSEAADAYRALHGLLVRAFDPCARRRGLAREALRIEVSDLAPAES
jgi:hypothetical protein